MIQKGVPAEFAERVFAQIRGFGEYGFPESHAASFALIVYVTAYLRRHYPAAFACALLNAQPMGFYSPATIVHDAKRHGVVVLAVDVNKSQWQCHLEMLPQTTHPGLLQPSPHVDKTTHAPAPTWAIRMGLCYVRGFGVHDKTAFEQTAKPFTDLQDVVTRLRLSSKSMLALGQSGALDTLGPSSRRAILWSLRGLLAERDDSLPMPSTSLKMPQVRRAHGQASLFAPLSADESILWDYQQTQHSTRGHPMQSVRSRLGPSIPDALSVNAMADKVRVTYVGMVICRQRPQTAQGVTFLTLEDETGFVNIVLWKDIYQSHIILAKTASLLGVQGRLQREGTVVHLVAQRLFAPELVQPHASVSVRNFQ
jgi:error-prone DNA polymerase